MAKKSIGVEFIPDEYKAGPFPPRRIHGVEFSRSGSSAIRAAIRAASGYYEVNQESFMAMFTLDMQVHDALCDEFQMVAAYLDDVQIRICEDLGIKWQEFEHNVPKLSVAGFLALTKQRLASLALPRNEVQWMAQRKRWLDLWFGWVARECAKRGCECDSHVRCQDLYGQPNFWEIAKSIEADREDKERLLAAMDAKPQGKAVRSVNASLARIAVRARA